MAPNTLDPPDALDLSPPRGRALAPDQLDALLASHLPALRAYVDARMGQRLAARESTDDVVQSVCCELAHEADAFLFHGEGAFRVWLYRTALHKIQRKHRYHSAGRRAAAREVPLAHGDADAPAVPTALGTRATPSRVLSMREQADRLETTMARLAAADREIIRLVRIAGLTHTDVAQHLGCTEDASRARLSRALARLAELLGVE